MRGTELHVAVPRQLLKHAREALRYAEDHGSGHFAGILFRLTEAIDNAPVVRASRTSKQAFPQAAATPMDAFRNKLAEAAYRHQMPPFLVEELTRLARIAAGHV